jgi:hypothetical protein
MKYFIITMALVVTVLSAETAIAQVVAGSTLTTPRGTILLHPQVTVPFTKVPAPAGGFLHGGGIIVR